jgi:hypothetical protein
MDYLKFMIEELLNIADISVIYTEMNWGTCLTMLSVAKTM